MIEQRVADPRSPRPVPRARWIHRSASLRVVETAVAQHVAAPAAPTPPSGALVALRAADLLVVVGVLLGLLVPLRRAITRTTSPWRSSRCTQH